MGKLLKKLNREAHTNLGKQDARRLTAFLDKNPGDAILKIGVLSETIKRETLAHLSPAHRKRVRIEVVKRKPEGLPGMLDQARHFGMVDGKIK